MENSELTVVIGLGKTGLSCVHYLMNKRQSIVVMDTRPNPPCLQELQTNYPQIPVKLGGFNDELLDQATEIIISPGISLKEPSIVKQLNRQIPVLGDIELFVRVAKAPIVAVTGSNGKSTVTTLIAHLIEKAGYKAKAGGNLGIPALDLLEGSTPDFYVLELSSFQLETTYSLQSLASVNLNISDDHMDRYENIDEYIKAKLKIYEGCAKPVINLDDTKSYAGFLFATQPTGFCLHSPKKNQFGIRTVNSETFICFDDQLLMAIGELPLKGMHQVANVLAALAIGHEIGLPMADMLEATKSFKGLPHRCQWVANVAGVDWYNDSKATNVGAAAAAITGIGPEIKGKVVLLAGGQGKNADFCPLYTPIKKYVRTVILYGEDKNKITNVLQGAAPIVETSSLDEAIKIAQKYAQKGDVVLLAPACASFDMFRNFEHRGEVFMELVRGLSV